MNRIHVFKIIPACPLTFLAEKSPANENIIDIIPAIIAFGQKKP